MKHPFEALRPIGWFCLGMLVMYVLVLTWVAFNE